MNSDGTRPPFSSSDKTESSAPFRGKAWLPRFRGFLATMCALCPLLLVPAQAAATTPNAPDASSAEGVDAEEKPARMIVERFKGPGAGVVRSGVTKRLDRLRGINLLAISIVDEQGLTFGSSAESYAHVAEELGLAVIVSGEVTVKNRRYQLELIFRNGIDGSILEVHKFEEPNIYRLRDRAAEGIPDHIYGIVARSTAPPWPRVEPEEVQLEEEPAALAPPAEEPVERRKEAEPAGSPLPSPLQFGAGGGLATRHYEYVGAIRGALRQYRLRMGPTAFVTGTWYPAAHFTENFFANIGLFGRYEQLVGVESRVAADRSLYTHSSSYLGGLRVRIPSGQHAMGVSLAYGRHAFFVEDTFVPDLDYRFVRAGLDGHLAVWRFLFDVGVGARFVLDAGQLKSQEWFPRAGSRLVGVELAAFGLEADLGVAFRLADSIYVRGGVTWLRYTAHLNGDPAEMNPNGVARVAQDQYQSGTLSVLFRWEPVSGAGATPEGAVGSE